MPYQSFDSYENEQERLEKQLPVCADCGEPIREDYAYCINGEWYCEQCMDSYKRSVCCI